MWELLCCGPCSIDSTKQDMKTMEALSEVVNCVQFNTIIPGRLYFVSCTADTVARLRAQKKVSVFSIDEDLVYENFFNDFGPLNLSMLYRYCGILRKKLASANKFQRKLIHVCSVEAEKRANAAYLMGSFQVIYLNRSSREALEALETPEGYIPFRDAAVGRNTFPLMLESCLSAIEKAHKLGWLDFSSFSCAEYEFYERVENGDLNWILPKKILAFCGPHNVCRTENGYTIHSPETYFDYFHKNNVTDIVRLNKRMYDSNKFTDNGFNHHDLYFLDGGVPTEEIMLKFIEICENAQGAVAVHCKAGLGRTGTLIGCYIMKHYNLNAQETIAWLRVCRPGSVIGCQQLWLRDREELLRSLQDVKSNNNELRGKKFDEEKSDESRKPKRATKNRKLEEDILKCVAEIKIESKQILETQGDRLNRVKARRKLASKVEKL